MPFATIVNRGEETPLSPVTQSPRAKGKRLTNSPPKVVLNGKTDDSTKQKRKTSNLSVSSTLSSISESQARSKQFEEEAAVYPGSMNLPPSLSRRAGEASDSPVLPLSPDPFGRFPSSVTQNTDGTNSSYVPPERTSSLAQRGQPDNGDPYERPPSKTPSSRFSADSVLEEAAANANLKATSNRSTLVSMKSIKKLWRKTNKSSISTMPSPDPSILLSRPPSSAASLHDTEYESSRAPSPSYPFSQAPPPMPSGRTSQASVRSVNLQAAPSQSYPARGGKSSRPDSGLDPFYFDQDSKYPVHRAGSPQEQYGMAPYQAGAPTPVTEKKRSVRKSILKWKSNSSSSINGNRDGAGERRQSTDRPDTRRRRPSILDVAGSMMRASVASASENSPSVPELPAEYRMSRQSRGSITTVQVAANGDERTQEQPVRTNSIRRKPVPSSSTDSSLASTEPIHTPVSAMGPSSSPDGNVALASPRSSDDVRLSFDATQFEIVSPKVGQFNFQTPHLLSS